MPLISIRFVTLIFALLETYDVLLVYNLVPGVLLGKYSGGSWSRGFAL